MIKFKNRIKNSWIESNILGRAFLIIFFPLWILTGFFNQYDN